MGRTLSEIFDYVIVGGGAAGCVLADRLSRDASKQVLLLEAGPNDDHPLIHMPKGVAKLVANPDYTWPFEVAAGRGSNAPPMTWVRGKTLGGSSAINGMMYVRGQPADFDELARRCGADWDWGNIASAYRDIEDHELGSAPTRGSSGPLRITMPSSHPLLEALIESGRSVGLDPQIDINQPDDAAKVGYCPRTIWRGRRQSAAVAFLRGARSRPNLHIKTGVVADRVIFDRHRVVGIDCRVRGAPMHYAARHIILSAGTLGSPAILQRSGIGAPSLLTALGIEKVVDCPAVGANLHEHCALALQFSVRPGMSQNASFGGWRLLVNGMRYYIARSGPLATGAYDVGGWFKTRPELDRPNAQFIAAPFSTDRKRGKGKLVMEEHPGMQVAVYPLRPRSTGQLAIISRDPTALPAVSLDFFADPEDCREMIDAVRYIRKLVSSGPLSELITQETRPGPELVSDADILDAYRRLGTTAYHAVGTCRMGTDDASVVNPRTAVRGVMGLNVVDLSIAPFVIAGNTFGPTVAMAHRAADLIVAEPSH